MRAPLLLLVLALCAPFAIGPALAQAPAVPTGCGNIELVAEPAPPAEPVPAGESVDVAIVVRNTGLLDARVTASASISEAGWTVDAPEPAVVAAGGEGTFRFAIAATSDATEDAVVSFAASGACETPLGATCPGSVCDAGTVNTQAVVRLAPDEGFEIPGLDALGGLRPEYLIAGIVLIGLASAIPFAMRRKKGGLAADCPEPLKTLRPGRGTSFPVEIRNTGKEPTSATFEIGPVPEGWSAFMPLPEVQLAGRESRSLWLMVRAPATAAVGETVDVELRMRDVRRNANGALVRVRAEVTGAGE